MAIHSRNYMDGGDVALVNCTHQSNVLLMDDSNLSAYQRGSSARYYGGFFKRFPAHIQAPSGGYWNVILEAPQGARYGINILKRG